jgi:excisionase family DNA binding protein
MGTQADADASDLVLMLPPGLVEEIAARAAAILAGQRPQPADDAWLDAEAAARYLGYGNDCARRGRQRIYDLVSQRRLRFAKDGSRLLFRREWLDEYIAGTVRGDHHGQLRHDEGEFRPGRAGMTKNRAQTPGGGYDRARGDPGAGVQGLDCERPVPAQSPDH